VSAEVELTPSTLIGLICAVARVERLPARGWALEIALDSLDRYPVAGDISVKRAVARWPRPASCAAKLHGIDLVVRQLAAAGHLVPSGRGWFAGYVPEEGWLEAHARLASSLCDADRQLLRRAVQGLQAALSTWSKKAVASGPAGSSTN
jgi:hypothetical protein